jgi:ubiquinone/menaquinone biosynthesis C-methylase UbiE
MAGHAPFLPGVFRVTQCKPYTGIASIYDRIMNHVHYEEWAPYIVSVFRRFDIPVSSILEIACGTGSHTRLFAQRGYRVIGLDRALPMLQVAQEKCRSEKARPHFVNADMTALPLGNGFDAVLCLYDSINYLCEKHLFQQALDEAARVTRPGGLYIFDVCTVRNSELYFSDNESTEIFGGTVCRRTSRYNSIKRIQENSFVIDTEDGACLREHHIQRIYRLSDIRDLIERTPFEVLDVFDDMSFLPGSEMSDRVHFVLKKPGSEAL